MNWFKLDDHSPSTHTRHNDDDEDEDDGRTHLKTPPHASTTTTTADLATPKSTTSTPATRPGSSRSRPSTADSTTRPNTNLARPNSRGQPQALRSANANKRSAAAGGDLPEQKARWVEGMIEKAKAASAEKKEGGEKGRGFGELGRVGGTRRMIFRQGSGTTGKGDGERG